MNTIWKFPIPVRNSFELDLPSGAQILYVDVQRDAAFLWAKVDPEVETSWRHFHLAGTGHILPDVELEHRGSFLIDNGSLVFHVFEEVRF